MPVLINFKICDNAAECNGVAVCPTHALSWYAKKNTIEIDNLRCTSCGLCEKSCLVGAIRVAKNQKEYKKIKREILADPRKVSDLFVDRYGAQPLHKAFLIPQEKFDAEVIGHHALVVAELFNADSIECLYCSIPIQQLFKDAGIKYRKVELTDDSLQKRFEVKKLPALLFFKEGKLLGKVEGHFPPEELSALEAKIKPFLK